jgi:uncharacterized protein
MKKRDGRPDLPLYSKARRAMMANWAVTPAQMDNVVKTFATCPQAELKIIPGDKLAVLRYPPAERECSPWFLVREDGMWKLDLTMMQRALRFNNRNQWRFDPKVSHEYKPAFAE